MFLYELTSIDHVQLLRRPPLQDTIRTYRIVEEESRPVDTSRTAYTSHVAPPGENFSKISPRLETCDQCRSQADRAGLLLHDVGIHQFGFDTRGALKMLDLDGLVPYGRQRSSSEVLEGPKSNKNKTRGKKPNKHKKPNKKRKGGDRRGKTRGKGESPPSRAGGPPRQDRAVLVPGYSGSATPRHLLAEVGGRLVVPGGDVEQYNAAAMARVFFEFIHRAREIEELSSTTFHRRQRFRVRGPAVFGGWGVGGRSFF